MITTRIIKGEIYRITHLVSDPLENCAYHFHKMGEQGHRITADSRLCNCRAYAYDKHEVRRCKHTEAAAEMDRERRMEVLQDMVIEGMGMVR